MERKQLVRDLKRAALARMESAARTVEDFQIVVKQWNHLDDNRERRERDHEVRRNQETVRTGYSDGLIFPIPFSHPAWRQALKGDFIDIIYDNAGEIWQLVEDWDVFFELKELKARQKEVLFLTAVRLCTPQQIACYRIALLDKPTIIWDFRSLLLGVQMMFSFMLTDEAKPLRVCRHCDKVFIAGHPNAAFCSPRCKNQYNVYKSRAKKAEEEKEA